MNQILARNQKPVPLIRFTRIASTYLIRMCVRGTRGIFAKPSVICHPSLIVLTLSVT